MQSRGGQTRKNGCLPFPEAPPAGVPQLCQNSTLASTGTGEKVADQSTFVPPPPCASTALSKHGVGVEPPF